jgi:hypothetical protein
MLQVSASLNVNLGEGLRLKSDRSTFLVMATKKIFEMKQNTEYSDQSFKCVANFFVFEDFDM